MFLLIKTKKRMEKNDRFREFELKARQMRMDIVDSERLIADEEQKRECEKLEKDEQVRKEDEQKFLNLMKDIVSKKKEIDLAINKYKQEDNPEKGLEKWIEERKDIVREATNNAVRDVLSDYPNKKTDIVTDALCDVIKDASRIMDKQLNDNENNNLSFIERDQVQKNMLTVFAIKSLVHIGSALAKSQH